MKLLGYEVYATRNYLPVKSKVTICQVAPNTVELIIGPVYIIVSKNINDKGKGHHGQVNTSSSINTGNST